MTSFDRTLILGWLFAALSVAAALSPGQPVRVESQEASRNLVNKIGPTLPQPAQIADPLYVRAVKVFEAAIIALPDMKGRYLDGLRNTLQEYARLKDARGETERARELEHKAAALQTN